VISVILELQARKLWKKNILGVQTVNFYVIVLIKGNKIHF